MSQTLKMNEELIATKRLYSRPAVMMSISGPSISLPFPFSSISLKIHVLTPVDRVDGALLGPVLDDKTELDDTWVNLHHR